MQTKVFKIEGGLSYPLAVPSTVEEFLSLAKGGEETILAPAISDIVYRGAQADFREALAASVEEEYKVARGRKDHATGKKDAAGNVVQVVAEPAGAYLKRVAAETGGKVADFQPLLDAIVAANEALPAGSTDKITFDPSQREPKGRTFKAGKADLEAAELLLSKDAEAFAAVCRAISAKIGRPLEPGVDKNTLALAYRDYRKARELEELKSLGA